MKPAPSLEAPNWEDPIFLRVISEAPISAHNLLVFTSYQYSVKTLACRTAIRPVDCPNKTPITYITYRKQIALELQPFAKALRF